MLVPTHCAFAEEAKTAAKSPTARAIPRVAFEDLHAAFMGFPSLKE
jgi:hypothetical protein